MVEGDIGRVAHFLVGGHAVGIFFGTGRQIRFTVIEQALERGAFLGPVVDGAGQIGIGHEAGVEIVEVLVDHVIDRLVGPSRVRSGQRLHEADLIKHAGKAVDLVDFLQAVEAVQHEAQLVIAVFGQLCAARAGGGRVVTLVIGRELVDHDHTLAVIEAVESPAGRQGEIVHGLHRNQIQPVLADEVDAVVPQAQYQLVAVAVIAVILAFLHQGGLPLGVEAGAGGEIQERGHGGELHEQVVVHEFEGVLVEVNDHGEAVLAGVAGDGAGGFEREPVACPVLFSVDGIEKLHPVLELHVGKVVYAVEEVERQLHAHIHAHRIEGKAVLRDLMPRREGRDAKGQEHCQYQEHAEQFFHLVSSFPYGFGFCCATYSPAYQTVILSAGAVYMPSPSCTPKVSWNFSKFDRGTLQRAYSTGCDSFARVGSSAAA